MEDDVEREQIPKGVNREFIPEGMATELTPDDMARVRYIAYARSATRSPEAVEEQIRDIHEFADPLGMICVDEVRLCGVNGLRPLFRPDLRELLARKKAKDDFDVLIMADCARLTRDWPDGFGRLMALFSLNGVRIIRLTDMIHAGPRR